MGRLGTQVHCPGLRRTLRLGDDGHDPALARVQVWPDDLEESRELLGSDLHVLTVLRAF